MTLRQARHGVSTLGSNGACLPEGLPEGAAGRRVLVVEDEFFIAEDIAQSFTESGARVVAMVGTVEEALTLPSLAPRIDGAVLDISLHGCPSFPVADVLQRLGVPFVFVTGCDKAAIPARHAAMKRLEKPANPDMIIRALFG